MRYHLFMNYGWFLQNHGKDFIRANMHTTVHPDFFENFFELLHISVGQKPKICNSKMEKLTSKNDANSCWCPMQIK